MGSNVRGGLRYGHPGWHMGMRLEAGVSRAGRGPAGPVVFPGGLGSAAPVVPRSAAPGSTVRPLPGCTVPPRPGSAVPCAASGPPRLVPTAP
jgi:hypothetical protein